MRHNFGVDNLFCKQGLCSGVKKRLVYWNATSKPAVYVVVSKMPNHGCTFAYIDFQPVIELDLKDSRQVHFSTFWRNRSNFKIARKMTRRLEEASNNNVRDSNGHLLSEDLVVVESRSGGECCNLYQCRYLCLYANKSLHADLYLLAGHQIYMHQSPWDEKQVTTQIQICTFSLSPYSTSPGFILTPSALSSGPSPSSGWGMCRYIKSDTFCNNLLFTEATG